MIQGIPGHNSGRNTSSGGLRGIALPRRQIMRFKFKYSESVPDTREQLTDCVNLRSGHANTATAGHATARRATAFSRGPGQYDYEYDTRYNSTHIHCGRLCKKTREMGGFEDTIQRFNTWYEVTPGTINRSGIKSVDGTVHHPAQMRTSIYSNTNGPYGKHWNGRLLENVVACEMDAGEDHLPPSRYPHFLPDNLLEYLNGKHNALAVLAIRVKGQAN
ncbi:hypothetical protein C8F04DRAFT_1202255 [Mycena alexandri]|uniref:Uncharacterized protein n=1 Tax=Mycena alexandri TaxID=1745969 RepID=A0AAD6RW80_9AGAR|nr:hypothetical protein C8F04DRAFT_1202255 [Mycena alexandri]